MKLLAIDFSNLVVRHHSNPYGKAADLAGRPVNGAVGACAQILRLLREHRPTHLLIAQDGSRADNVRRQIDPTYKDHRGETDDEIRYQFAKAYEAVDLLGFPRLAIRGYEADDVIASATRAFAGSSLVVSGDKDLLALCSDAVRVQLLRPGAAKLCGPAECREIFGVAPERVRDYKALVGDPSDGIKGISGVGPKSALALLAAHGSLEAILAAAAADRLEARPALAAKVKAGAADARASYELARLYDSLEIETETLALGRVPAHEELADELRERGLGDLAKSLPGAPKQRKPKPARDFDALFERAVSEAAEKAQRD